MMPVQDTSRQADRQARVNGGPARVIPMPRNGGEVGKRHKESWELLKEWADKRGWGSWKCAGAMLVAATPEERKRLPEQHVLSGYWRRWLKGEHVPEAHMADPNANGFYRPIIARMMGTTPYKIWPARRWAYTGAEGVQGELAFRRDRTASKLTDLRQQLADLREQALRMQDIEDSIGKLEAELNYLDAVLDAVLAVPVSGSQGGV